MCISVCSEEDGGDKGIQVIMDQVIGSNRAVVCVLLFCFLVKGNTKGVGKESAKVVQLKKFLKRVSELRSY